MIVNAYSRNLGFRCRQCRQGIFWEERVANHELEGALSHGAECVPATLDII